MSAQNHGGENAEMWLLKGIDREKSKKESYRPRAGEVCLDGQSQYVLKTLWDRFGCGVVKTWCEHTSMEHGKSSSYRIMFRTATPRNRVERHTGRDFKRFFGAQVAAVVPDPSCRVLDGGLFQQLHLAAASGRDEDVDFDKGVDSPSWVIRVLWLSDGSDGKEEGEYYATDEKDGEAYMIDLYTFAQCGMDLQAEQRERTNAMGARFWGNNKTRIQKILEIDAWCVEHPGRRRRVNVAKSRLPSPFERLFFTQTETIFRDVTDECLRASFANSLAMLRDNEEADDFWTSQALEAAEEVRVQGYARIFCCSKELEKEAGKMDIGLEKVMDASVEFFVERAEKAIYLARITSTDADMHAICLDLRGDEGVIIDSSERFHAKFSGEAFIACVGHDMTFARLDDVRKVVEKRKMNRGMNRLYPKQRKRARLEHGPTSQEC